MKNLIDIDAKIVKNKESGFRIQVKKEDIEKLSDFDLMQMIHERNLDFCWDNDKHKLDYNKVNKSQKALYSLFVIVGDVDNGGFIQFFQNTQDEFFEIGLESFKLIGDNETAKVFSKAIEVYKRNESFLSGRNLDAKFTDEEDKELEALDSKFSELGEQREEKLSKFVKQHIEDFIIFN